MANDAVGEAPLPSDRSEAGGQEAAGQLAGTAIVERIGWEDREDGPAFTATLVFRNGPPDLSPIVIWKALPVRISLVECRPTDSQASGEAECQ